MYTDATRYESEMRYPTGQKLLRESNEKAYTVMCEASGRLGIHRPRTKYLDVARANMGYTKQRKHSRSQTSSIVRGLLQLLGKILKEIRKMERAYAGKDVLADKERRAIARNFGTALNNGAHLTALRRTRIGSLCVEDAIQPEVRERNKQ